MGHLFVRQINVNSEASLKKIHEQLKDFSRQIYNSGLFSGTSTLNSFKTDIKGFRFYTLTTRLTVGSGRISSMAMRPVKIAPLVMRQCAPVSKFQINCLGSLLPKEPIGRDYSIWAGIGKLPCRYYTHGHNCHFNAVDQQRIKDIGYDWVVAEWDLPVGATVKWVGKDEPFHDYSSLHVGHLRPLNVESIYATNSGIIHPGFPRLMGLQHFNKGPIMATQSKVPDCPISGRIWEQPRRHFTHWLNCRFNAVDQQRIEDVGYDRATAEWCLRVGATVKWVGKDEPIRDYNSLPVGQFRSLKVESIDATDSGIMHAGFPHLKGLQYFNKLILVNCIYIESGSLASLTFNAKALEWLEVVNCGDVTGGGLRELVGLPNLKYLRLEKLVGVEKPKPVLDFLRAGLPNCEIDYPDAE